MLPEMYKWLYKEQGPKMLLQALKFYGLQEIVGPKHNDVILQWAVDLGISSLVHDDEQAWCGLFMAHVAQLAEKDIPMQGWDILRALQWVNFGSHVNVPMLGDVLIFKRTGGGHVGMYIGEDETHYHVLGGNQGNKVSIVRIEKGRLHQARRPKYINQPKEVRVIRLSPTGVISQNEA